MSEHLKNLHEHLRACQSRKAVDWLAALEETINGWEAILKQDQAPSKRDRLLTLLAEAFLPVPRSQSRCVLLSASGLLKASPGKENAEKLETLLRRCRILHSDTGDYLGKHYNIEGEFWLRGIGLRLDCIDLVLADKSESEIKDDLERLLETARKQFQTEDWSKLKYRPTTLPAAVRRLDDLNPRLTELLSKIVDPSQESETYSDSGSTRRPLGWFDPAAVFLCNTLLAIIDPDQDVLPEKQRRDDDTGITWVLIAFDLPGGSSPSPTGLLLRFSIEVVPNGCGVLYPHPGNMAHIATAKTFQQSLRNAWSVVLGDDGVRIDKPQCDYRWSLSVYDDSTDHNCEEWHKYRRELLLSPLEGQSGEVAIASALRSAVEDTPVELSCAVTAQFEDISKNRNIKPVTSIGPKAHALERVHINSLQLERGMHLQIDRVIFAKNQDMAVFKLPERLTPVEYDTFDEVFEELSRNAIATRAFKQRLRAEAAAFFKRKYSGSGTADSKPQEDVFGKHKLNPMTRMSDERDGEMVTLEGDALENLLRGILRDDPTPGVIRVRPLRLLGDRGAGKTSLLRRCQFKIATDPGPRIPVFVEKPSSCLNHDTKEEFIKRIVAGLKKYLPDDDGAKGQQWNDSSRQTWLTGKVRGGEVVFLLDGLVQDKKDDQNLNTVVNEITECPFLLTRLTEEDRSFQGNTTEDDTWDEVNLLTWEDPKPPPPPWPPLWWIIPLLMLLGVVLYSIADNSGPAQISLPANVYHPEQIRLPEKVSEEAKGVLDAIATARFDRSDNPAPDIGARWAILARRVGENRFDPIESGDSLRSEDTNDETEDDAYLIAVETDTRAFMYVFQIDSSGVLSWLFPQTPSSNVATGQNPVPADQTVVLPAGGQQAITLDQRPGDEFVFVVLAHWPIADLESLLDAERDRELRVQANHEVVSLDEKLQSKLRSRGPSEIVSVDTQVTIPWQDREEQVDLGNRILGNSNGIVVLSRWFRHEPPYGVALEE